MSEKRYSFSELFHFARHATIQLYRDEITEEQQRKATQAMWDSDPDRRRTLYQLEAFHHKSMRMMAQDYRRFFASLPEQE